ncbi:MAG TPA: addiction module protein [Longimicrobium sp.]|nr:addiction module protein [Longimicrobium sp.]
MSMISLSRERIETEALQLPASERAALAHRLIASLEEDGEDDPADVELAWTAEIRRRLNEYRRGEVQPIPSDEVFAKARKLLK